MSRKWKQVILILFDTFIIQIAHIGSYFFLHPLIDLEPRPFFIHLLLVVFVYVLLGFSTKLFDKINRFTGTKETLIHATIVTLSFLIGSLIYTMFDATISFRYITFAYLISVIALPSSRIIWRMWIDHQRRLQNSAQNSEKPIRTLLVGAGDAGAIFVQSLRNRSDINVAGFLDDDKNKQGTVLHGYQVIGRLSDLEEVVKQYDIEQITIAIPSLS